MAILGLPADLASRVIMIEASRLAHDTSGGISFQTLRIVLSKPKPAGAQFDSKKVPGETEYIPLPDA